MTPGYDVFSFWHYWFNDTSPLWNGIYGTTNWMFGPGFERFVHVGKSAGVIRFQHRLDERDEKPGKVLVLDKETEIVTKGPYLKDMFPVHESPNNEKSNPSHPGLDQPSEGQG